MTVTPEHVSLVTKAGLSAKTSLTEQHQDGALVTMAKTSAERQREYIARLRAKASGINDAIAAAMSDAAHPSELSRVLEALMAETGSTEAHREAIASGSGLIQYRINSDAALEVKAISPSEMYVHPASKDGSDPFGEGYSALSASTAKALTEEIERLYAARSTNSQWRIGLLAALKSLNP